MRANHARGRSLAPPLPLPQRLCFQDLIVLAIVGGCALQATSKLLPAPDPAVQIVLVIAWTALAAHRLLAWRHGTARAIAGRGALQTLAMFTGMAPWIALTLFPEAVQDAPPWMAANFPPALRDIGSLLIVMGVLAPFWTAVRSRSVSDNGFLTGRGRPMNDGCAHAIGIFLLSSNLLLGVLAGGWIVLRYCFGHTVRTLLVEQDSTGCGLTI